MPRYLIKLQTRFDAAKKHENKLFPNGIIACYEKWIPLRNIRDITNN